MDSSYVRDRDRRGDEEQESRLPGMPVRTDWEDVYRSTYQDLLRFLTWMLSDEDRAKDLVQESFARVLGQDADNPRGLVFRVATNLARDEARLVVRRKRHLALLRHEADARFAHAGSPASDLEAREAHDRLHCALSALSDVDRDVLLLWDAGMSYREIATQTGLSKGAIGTTVARAKKKLVAAHDALGSSDAALG
jgi:RNA polymerase sigma-70 factor (ECF subfamily)